MKLFSTWKRYVRMNRTNFLGTFSSVLKQLQNLQLNLKLNDRVFVDIVHREHKMMQYNPESSPIDFRYSCCTFLLSVSHMPVCPSVCLVSTKSQHGDQNDSAHSFNTFSKLSQLTHLVDTFYVTSYLYIKLW